MNELMSVPTDADFFDWAADVESRFFLAPELGIVSGFAPRAAASDRRPGADARAHLQA